ncbi:MAG: hypothetical protein SNJ60_04375 [Pseudanabaenaceae cyanobacterium]
MKTLMVGLSVGWVVGTFPVGASPVAGVQGAGQGAADRAVADRAVADVAVEVPADVLRVAQEAISPVVPEGATANLPVVMDRSSARQAAVKLILRARQLLDAPGERPSLLEINATLAAYNDLIVRLGLTEPAQLSYFPRIQAIGLALAEIRAQNVQP